MKNKHTENRSPCKFVCLKDECLKTRCFKEKTRKRSEASSESVNGDAEASSSTMHIDQCTVEFKTHDPQKSNVSQSLHEDVF